MPPYIILALIMSLVWLCLVILRKNSRQKMLVMSLAVIPFAFFDYFSQPGYWHPQTFFSMPVGIEGMIFGFSFGGVAAVLYSVDKDIVNKPAKQSIAFKNIVALSPVLITSLGLYFLFGINMMISLPIGLLTGCIVILKMRPNLGKKLLYSGLYFGLLYTFVLSFWLLLFPHARDWWDLDIYGGITLLNVPLGEVIFGFIFSAFWGVLYEFILEKSKSAHAQ